MSLTVSSAFAFNTPSPFLLASSSSCSPSRNSPGETVAGMEANSSSQILLPESHQWPSEACPRVAHNEYVPGLELPVIDLLEGDESCRLKLRKACEEWGFFHVVNHEVSPELLERMMRLSVSFFGLPAEKKLETTQGSRKFRLYDSFTRKKYTACSWVEGLNVHDLTAIPHIAKCVWPESSDEISKVFTAYLGEMEKVGNRILLLLLLSLGLEESEMPHRCGFTGTRFNYYPACPDPSKVLGLVPHTDPNFMTILHQDEVGGLQIAKDDQWIAVKPIKNAFVINIGDSFQAWSNCRYKSVEHRVVVNSQSPRVSIAYFFGPTDNLKIEPPGQLVDGDHPLVHRSFTYQEYMSWRTQSNLIGKNAFNIFADPLIAFCDYSPLIDPPR